jgi:hypothetical protein
MIPDDELEKLAREYSHKYNRGVFADGYADSFMAGFRAAEQMMQDRWPSEEQITKAKNDGVFRYEPYQDHCEIIKFYRWLKQKILSAK